ncbi:hypothetical protein BJY01DRAFT_246221 [Aspergillus pseudoustus]|uniref:Uncharacterized protein n=1 Tax=Aspergillus pseudoustus TaxID=1810923 RepID=A0ABR4K976_9EURO
MCTFYTVKYLCNCIYDEWILPCYFTRGPSILLRRPNNTQPDSQASSCSSSPPSTPDSPTESSPNTLNQNKQPCYHARIVETYDVLTLCEGCFAQLDAQVRAHGVKAVLAAPERFPLAEKLGMLIVIENDELEQWRVFRKGEQCFLLQREVGVESLRGMGGKVSVPVVGPAAGTGAGGKVRRPDADAVWKVESSRIYQLDYTIYAGSGNWGDGESSITEDGSVFGRYQRPKSEGAWEGTYYEERPLGHHPEPENSIDG